MKLIKKDIFNFVARTLKLQWIYESVRRKGTLQKLEKKYWNLKNVVVEEAQPELEKQSAT